MDVQQLWLRRDLNYRHISITRPGYDLLFQTMAEWNIGHAIVAKSYQVSDDPYWIGDTLGSIAISRGTTKSARSLRLLEKWRVFLAVSWDRSVDVGANPPPS